MEVDPPRVCRRKRGGTGERISEVVRAHETVRSALARLVEEAGLGVHRKGLACLGSAGPGRLERRRRLELEDRQPGGSSRATASSGDSNATAR